MASLIGKFRNWMRAQQDRQYLAQVGGHALSDLGFSRADLEILASSPSDTRERMQAMAAAHGLDADVLNNERWRQIDMATACGQCGEREQCKRWLGAPAQDRRVADFCPNARHFSELALMTGVSAVALNKKLER